MKKFTAKISRLSGPSIALFTGFVLSACSSTPHTAPLRDVASRTTSFNNLKNALVEEQGKSSNSMYEYELDFKFTVPGFFGTKKVGDASVAGRNGNLPSADRLQLENDGLDKAMKKVFVHEKYIEIIFSVNEWKTQGRPRGSEGAVLRFISDSPDAQVQVYVNNGIEFEPSNDATVMVDNDKIIVHYSDFSRDGELRTLVVERNSTLDMSLFLGDSIDPTSFLANYSGGKR